MPDFVSPNNQSLDAQKGLQGLAAPPASTISRHQEALTELCDLAKNSLAVKSPWIFEGKEQLAAELCGKIDGAVADAKSKVALNLDSAHTDPVRIVEEAIFKVAKLLWDVDGHSFAPLPRAGKNASDQSSVSGTEIAATAQAKQPPLPELKITEARGHRIARLVVPQCVGPSAMHYDTFCRMLRGFIDKSEGQGVNGYIVDVRGNGGGNMFPMYAGLLPLLGLGDMSFFLTPPEDPGHRRDFNKWSRKGTGFFAEAIAAKGSDTLCHATKKPVALWQDGGTASSGEQVLILFAGREHSRRFGSPSYGLTTANRPYQLLNDPRFPIIIAECVSADRTGALYYGKISPNEMSALSDEALLERTATWFDEGAR